MPDVEENYSFEDFPRKPLPEMISRRELYPALMTRIRVDTHKTQGQKVLKLSELGEAPDELLSAIIPVIVKNSLIATKEGFVTGRPPKSDRSYKLFPLDSPALKVFNAFNGFNSLDKVSQELEQETGWEPVRCFAYTRGLFLALVVAGLCLPKDG